MVSVFKFVNVVFTTFDSSRGRNGSSFNVIIMIMCLDGGKQISHLYMCTCSQSGVLWYLLLRGIGMQERTHRGGNFHL